MPRRKRGQRPAPSNIGWSLDDRVVRVDLEFLERQIRANMAHADRSDEYIRDWAYRRLRDLWKEHGLR